MSFVAAAVIGAGATLAAGAIGASSSSKASKAQANAANQAAQLQADAAQRQLDFQREMFQTQREMQEPWRAAGVNALNRIEMREDDVPGPFRATTAMPGAFTGQVNMMADPGYQFRLSEGLKALDRQAAARGGLISGGALKAAGRYGQDYASGEYQNAYNRALTEYNAAMQRSQMGYGRELDAYNAEMQRSAAGYNRLASMAGLGQTSVGQIGSAAQNYANLGSNALGTMGAAQAGGVTGAANARASGYMGQANALASGLGNIGSMYMQGQMMNSLFGSGGGGGYTPYGNTGYSYMGPLSSIGQNYELG
jgi:hypothetical protein